MSVSAVAVAAGGVAADDEAVNDDEWVRGNAMVGVSRQNKTSINPATTKTRYDPISFSTVGGAQLTKPPPAQWL